MIMIDFRFIIISFQDPPEPFYFTASICTVLLLIPNRLAASRTVVRFSMIKTASSQARSSIFPFKLKHAPYPVMLHIYVKEQGNMREFGENKRRTRPELHLTRMISSLQLLIGSKKDTSMACMDEQVPANIGIGSV